MRGGDVSMSLGRRQAGIGRNKLDCCAASNHEPHPTSPLHQQQPLTSHLSPPTSLCLCCFDPTSSDTSRRLGCWHPLVSAACRFFRLFQLSARSGWSLNLAGAPKPYLPRPFVLYTALHLAGACSPCCPLPVQCWPLSVLSVTTYVLLLVQRGLYTSIAPRVDKSESHLPSKSKVRRRLVAARMLESAASSL